MAQTLGSGSFHLWYPNGTYWKWNSNAMPGNTTDDGEYYVKSKELTITVTYEDGNIIISSSNIYTAKNQRGKLKVYGVNSSGGMGHLGYLYPTDDSNYIIDTVTATYNSLYTKIRIAYEDGNTDTGIRMATIAADKSFSTGSWGKSSGYFTHTSMITQYDISITAPNLYAPTVSFKTLPTLYAGQSAKIQWTTSDGDGDTVYTTKLVRYYKASGATKYSSYNVYSSSLGTTTKYKNDTIPDIVGGSIYYIVTVTDKKGYTATATSSTVTVQKYNTAPTGSISVSPSTLYNGKTANISWSLSDAEGDTITTTKLVRYYKAAGASSYSSTTLTTSNVTSYTDTIPKTLAGGSVYYVVTFTDGTVTATATSSTFTIATSCNVSVISGGVIIDASDIAIISNGVITSMDGELHAVISGVIT